MDIYFEGGLIYLAVTVVFGLFAGWLAKSLSPNPPKRRRHAGKTGNDGRGDATVQVWSQ